jgi:pimeloyl-ACP methyl ester carboxylesterase
VGEGTSTSLGSAAARIAGWLGLLALSGCVSLRTPVPMTARTAALGSDPARCLIVLLPGLGDEGRTFFDEGFVARLRAAGLSADLIAADATLGYYRKGSFIARLDADLLGPARQRGYARTWLVGASMGGFGSLFYASQRPEEVDGVLALAPWLGEDEVLSQIRDAGGLAHWQPPPPGPVDADNFQPQLWGWLRGVALEGRPGPELWLGYGRGDRLRAADGLLAAALPEGRVLTTPGGHRWSTWRELLGEFLERSSLAAECRGEPATARAQGGPG